MVSTNTATASAAKDRVTHVIRHTATPDRGAGTPVRDQETKTTQGDIGDHSEKGDNEVEPMALDRPPSQNSVSTVRSGVKGRRKSANRAENTTTRRTRSKTRLGKKRVLEEAAALTSSEELPERILPLKKTKMDSAKSAPQAVEGKKVVEVSSDVEITEIVKNTADARFKRGIQEAIVVEDSSSDGEYGSKIHKKKVHQAEAKPVSVKKEKSLPVTVKKEPGVSNEVSTGSSASVSRVSDENPFLSSPDEMTSDRLIKAIRFMHPEDDSIDEDEALALAKTLLALSRTLKDKKHRNTKRSSAILEALDKMDIDQDRSTELSTDAANVPDIGKYEGKGKGVDRPSAASAVQIDNEQPASRVSPLANSESAAGVSVPMLKTKYEVSGEQANESSANQKDTSSTTTSTSKAIKRPTFAQFVNPSRVTPMLSSGSIKILDDTMKFHVKVLPKKCQVTFPEDQQDRFLADTYKDLPNLSHGILHSWNSIKADAVMRLVKFSGWDTQCPTLDWYNALNAVTFKRKDNFVNPSRASPLEVNIMYTSDDRKRAVLQCNNTTAICISSVLSGESHLVEPSTQGLRNKYLTGFFHHQEWERFAGFSCMVFDHKSMIAQIREGALSFGTMGNRADREYASPSKPIRNPDILSGQKESKTRAANRTFKANVGFKSILDSNDNIPVYDARNYYFDFDKDLGRVSEVLVPYHGEIPSGSFVVVAYTMTQYEKDKSYYLSTNILFAILFATEDMRVRDEDNEEMEVN